MVFLADNMLEAMRAYSLSVTPPPYILCLFIF